MKSGAWCGLVLISLGLAACGSKHESSGGGTGPSPGLQPKQPGHPVSLTDAPLAVTESLHPWQLNVVSADAGTPAQVTRTFTFKPTTGGSMTFGYLEQQAENCAQGTDFDYQVTLHDDSAPGTPDQPVKLEQCFGYQAGHALRFLVTVDNVGNCDAVKLSIGFLHQSAC